MGKHDRDASSGNAERLLRPAYGDRIERCETQFHNQRPANHFRQWGNGSGKL